MYFRHLTHGNRIRWFYKHKKAFWMWTLSILWALLSIECLIFWLTGRHLMSLFWNAPMRPRSIQTIFQMISGDFQYVASSVSSGSLFWPPRFPGISSLFSAADAGSTNRILYLLLAVMWTFSLTIRRQVFNKEKQVLLLVALPAAMILIAFIQAINALAGQFRFWTSVWSMAQFGAAALFAAGLIQLLCNLIRKRKSHTPNWVVGSILFIILFFIGFCLCF